MGTLWWNILFEYLSRNKIPLDAITDYYDRRETVELVTITNYPYNLYPTVEVSIVTLKEIETDAKLGKGIDSIFKFYEATAGTCRVMLASDYGINWAVNEQRQGSKNTKN